MRRLNAILTAAIMVLFLLHGMMGSMVLLGGNNSALKALAYVSVGLVLCHAVIGCKLTWDTVKAIRKSGKGYFRENLVFWVRRLSGVLVLVLVVFHMLSFSSQGSGLNYRLPWFTGIRLAENLLLVAAIGLHVLSNVRPAAIAFGIPGIKKWAGDILLVLTILLIFMAAAFLFYYHRWNVL